MQVSRPAHAGRSHIHRPSQMARRRPLRDVVIAKLDLRLTLLSSAELISGSRRDARGIAGSLLMPERSGNRFLAERHLDSSNAPLTNLILSAREAAAVMDFLLVKASGAFLLEVRGSRSVSVSRSPRR